MEKKKYIIKIGHLPEDGVQAIITITGHYLDMNYAKIRMTIRDAVSTLRYNNFPPTMSGFCDESEDQYYATAVFQSTHPHGVRQYSTKQLHERS
jgi:hypothetical protein